MSWVDVPIGGNVRTAIVGGQTVRYSLVLKQRHGRVARLSDQVGDHNENLCALSDRVSPSALLCHRAYAWFHQDRSQMVSGHASWLNALNSFRRTRL